MKKLLFCLAVLLLMAGCASKKAGLSDQDRQRIDQEYDQYKQQLK